MQERSIMDEKKDKKEKIKLVILMLLQELCKIGKNEDGNLY